ncbi:hypothetical protein DESC_180054 [Desulfosarcina cetonica]|nr:hypothetical protein DESC_180054 [Desulfosarcina cetonica]
MLKLPLPGDANLKAAGTSWPGCGCLFLYAKKQKATKTGVVTIPGLRGSYIKWYFFNLWVVLNLC